MTSDRREQMSGAEGCSGLKKGGAEVEKVFRGNVACYWPHLWM